MFISWPTDVVLWEPVMLVSMWWITKLLTNKNVNFLKINSFLWFLLASFLWSQWWLEYPLTRRQNGNIITSPSFFSKLNIQPKDVNLLQHYKKIFVLMIQQNYSTIFVHIWQTCQVLWKNLMVNYSHWSLNATIDHFTYQLTVTYCI